MMKILKKEKKVITFLLLTGLVALLMTITNLFNFIVSTIIDFPIWVGILWTIASIGSIVLYSLLLKNFTWIIIPGWFGITTLFVIVFLICTNWNKFLICFANFFHSEIARFIPGFGLVMVLFITNRLILWGLGLFKDSKKQKKQD